MYERMSGSDTGRCGSAWYRGSPWCRSSIAALSRTGTASSCWNGALTPLLHLRGGQGRERSTSPGLCGAGRRPALHIPAGNPWAQGPSATCEDVRVPGDRRELASLRTRDKMLRPHGDERRSCFDNVIGRPTWDSFGRAGVGSLPRSRVYEDIVLDVGGVEARRTKIGSNTGSDRNSGPKTHRCRACDHIAAHHPMA